MTRTERKLLTINGLVGVVLTLSVVLLDHFNQLRVLERAFYARRARDCQFFTKPPTDKIVFLDIDDAAMDTVGRWPWPRSTMATIIDEIAAAKPSLIFLDIIYPEPDRNPKDDQKLADAIGRAGNVLVPFSISTDAVPPESALLKASREILLHDLEFTPEQFAAKLTATGFQPPKDVRQWLDLFVVARRKAMFERISAEMARRPNLTAAELRPLLLPRHDTRIMTSPLLRLLSDQHQRAEKLVPLRRFSRPPDANSPPLLRRNEENEKTPIVELGRRAGASGYVDYIADDDGVVRRIPLLALHHNRVVPQVGLVIACNLLGADPNTVAADAHSLTIPLPDGRKRVVPVVTRSQTDTGEPIGVLMDIPYSGGRDWKTALDPQGRRPACHVPINSLWQIVQTRESILLNNATADRAIGDLEPIFLSAVEEYRARKLDPADYQARLRYLIEFLKNIDNWRKQYEGVADLNEQERKEKESLNYARQGIEALITNTQRLGGELTGYQANLASQLSGKAVLVGSVATSMVYDMKPTPLHEACPGVVIHGIIANDILSGELWSAAPLWVTRVITLAMGLTVTAFVLLMAPWKAALSAGALLLGYFAVNGVLLLDYMNVIVGVAGPVVAAGVTWSSCQLVAFLVEKAERRRITDRFAAYADPALVQWVVDHPEQAVMTGQTREMTVMFTDLGDFTKLSEQLKEKVVPLLNEYLGLMSDIATRHRGVVNKFVGDGIMCFYNAPEPNPDHAIDAARTILEMQEELVRFNESLARRDMPQLVMRAGIVTGEMVVGDAGTAKRADYTVLGDNVNLASRLEGANKVVGTSVLMNGRAVELLGDRFLWRPVARFQVVGKRESVVAYELIAEAARATDPQKHLTECSKAVFECFVEGHFERCLDAVGCMEDSCGPSRLTKVYRELSSTYVTQPPVNGFDGSIVLTEK
jgi:class 3 adenylate cyclase/CHASE2 domain-containing sensor protein